MTKIVVSDPIASRRLELLRAEGWQVVECKGSPADKLAFELADAAGLAGAEGCTLLAQADAE